MKQRKIRPVSKEPQQITKSVTYIRLDDSNPGKLAALNHLAQVYLALCQHYVTLFSTTEQPDKFHTPCFQTPLSERWHRVAIQQAAGIAKSWRANRANAYQDYLDALAEHQEQAADGVLQEGAKEPQWREWDVPTLHQNCIQANCNVIKPCCLT